MDEELQSKIALALDKMINGAPEVWQALVLEVQTRGTVMVGIGAMSVVCGIASIYKACKLDDWDNYSIAYLIPGVVAVITGGMVGLVNLHELLAPSLTLLKMLR